jgi:F-type H+/Na+-transporting ATPase subunit alpha
MRGNLHVRFCERLWCKQPYYLLSLDASTKKVLERGERLTQILKQDQFSTSPTAIQVVMLYAGSKGYLDILNLSQIEQFMTIVTNDLTAYKWPFVETIVATKDYDSEAESSMQEYITDTVNFIQSE